MTPSVPATVPMFDPETQRKREWAAASSRVALPLILQFVPGVASVVEVGCRSGQWLAEAQRRGIAHVQGIEGPWFDLTDLSVDRSVISVVDYSSSLTLDRSYDLALCLEVAEHLPATRAASFIAQLTRVAPVVAFSAAIPGQGGLGHVNEQWPAYWEGLFAEVGYRFVDAVRLSMWRAPGGPAYIAQNLFLAVDERRLDKYPALAEIARTNHGPALALVHPEVFARVPGVRSAARDLAFAVKGRVRRELSRVLHR